MAVKNRKRTPGISRLVICLSFLILNTTIASANTENTSLPITLQPVEWDHDYCICKGKIDISKLPAETATLIMTELSDFQVNDSISWSKLGEYSIEDLKKERDSYTEQHNTIIDKLQRLNFPEIPALLKYRQERIFEEKIKHFLYASELNYLITASITHLENELEGHSHKSQCGKYSEMLSSEKKLKDSLSLFMDEKCLKNNDIASCRSRIIGDINDLKSEKIHILMLGWHNCANHFYRDIQPPNHEVAVNAINQYMSDITCECEM